MRSLDAIRDEHDLLLPHIRALLNAADAVDLPGHAVFELIDDAWRFLADHLLVHAALEEQVLYPAITATLGAPEAVHLLTMDHRVIHDLVDELRQLRRHLADRDDVSSADKRDLRRVLFGLHALVQAHFQKEEQIALPLLEARMTPSEAERLVRTMHPHKEVYS